MGCSGSHTPIEFLDEGAEVPFKESQNVLVRHIYTQTLFDFHHRKLNVAAVFKRPKNYLEWVIWNEAVARPAYLCLCDLTHGCSDLPKFLVARPVLKSVIGTG